ncbi:MAG: hypothetical protein FWE40_05475 [Oscillospiraceae bacterium]|jgi:hypothetical protein|nr:hypothetical protein [Oscillospiraceae bacterium]
MELWEFYLTAKGWAERERLLAKRGMIECWTTANLTGAAFAGKLKPMNHYVKDENDVKAAPKISIEDFKAKLAAAERGELHG